MAWAQIGRLSVQILRALERAHSLGVVHRDIKPANIFICSGVLGEVAQVLDFGLAKMVKEPETELTQAGALLGTPRYMAPEQVRGETITHAADIYSFGLVMAEMLLGRPLVTGAKELDIYVAQGSDKPIFVPDDVLSSPFGNIIQRAVDKKVEVRYHMASQMLADVEAVLANLEGPQDDIEADLDATRMIDPSMAAVLSNPHAEKMRRVLNAAANKKAAETAKIGGPAPAKTSETKAPDTAERPTRVPPSMQGPTVPIEDVGPPPPIPAEAYDLEPVVPSGIVSSGPRGVAPLPEPLSGPISSGPLASGTVPIAELAPPPMQTPSPPIMANDLGLPMPQAKPKQTGLAIALVLVVLLIVAGMGAIAWMLGLVPV